MKAVPSHNHLVVTHCCACNYICNVIVMRMFKHMFNSKLIILKSTPYNFLSIICKIG